MTCQCRTPERALREQENETPSKGEPSVDNNRGEFLDERLESADAETGGVLVCRVCHSRITRRDLGMAINGSRRHVFFNPDGLVFELGCFASARNLTPAGPETDEFTWFPGYRWQVVLCTGCSTQLGWRYVGADGGFFGLILKALMEEEQGIKS
ncbi:cereblon family protein [uncultured Pseudodesulfovibrio sp.]|uniref:cereblon family protein n=1 Tax=uncultured Pseudodesulfovibrio sp. TaxID=2035858 RepID=UPI0029C98D0A|nr:cereblon family protein [uncultured Pseudodesulfovibrio sp.]